MFNAGAAFTDETAGSFYYRGTASACDRRQAHAVARPLTRSARRRRDFLLRPAGGIHDDPGVVLVFRELRSRGGELWPQHVQLLLRRGVGGGHAGSRETGKGRSRGGGDIQRVAGGHEVAAARKS